MTRKITAETVRFAKDNSEYLLSQEGFEKSTGLFPDREADADKEQHRKHRAYRRAGVHVCGSWEEVTVSNSAFQEGGVLSRC